MTKQDIHQQIQSILQTSRRIDYQEIKLYLITQSELKQILDLELTVRMNEQEKGVKKKNYFYDYAKIINPEHPAFKYTLSMKHKKKEIFDPEKVRKALPSEFEIWKNTARVKLEKEIKDPETAITDEQGKNLRLKLEKDILLAQEKIDKVLNDFYEYDVVISTFEQYSYYPALYYVMELGDSKTKASDTHLRKEVPNLLWYRDERPFAELRANDRMSRIIQTFERYCETVYIQKKK
jgi:hypothetical protein